MAQRELGERVGGARAEALGELLGEVLPLREDDYLRLLLVG